MHALALLPVLFGTSFATLFNTQYPHLLLPLKSWAPNTAFPTAPDANVTYNSQTGAQQWTAVSFDVPYNEATKCRLNFHVNQNLVKNAPFTLKGTSEFAINISRLEPNLINGVTTWSNRPAVTEYYDTYVLTPDGNGKATVTTIHSKWFECPKNGVAQFIIHPASGRDLTLYWFELNYDAASGGPHGVTLEMHTD